MKQRLHLLPKLPRQNRATLGSQSPMARRLRDRPNKNIVFEGGVITLPRRHPRSARRRRKFFDDFCRPADGEVMGEPVRVGNGFAPNAL